MEGEDFALHAYALYPGQAPPIVPAGRRREWMDKSDGHSAYRCLPLSIANQHGWHILSKHHVRAVWNGSPSPLGLTVEVLGGDGYCWAMRNFGDGIITWMIPYLFRTPPGYNLLARGPANMPKDGVSPLEGLIETDWAHATFTMNWKLTRPNHPVEFAIGEPICAIVPQRRGLLEAFSPHVAPLDRTTELGKAYQDWADARVTFRETTAAKDNRQIAKSELWQKDYFFGRRSDGIREDDHQTSLQLAPFAADPALRADPAFANGGLEWTAPEIPSSGESATLDP